jgi:hypothetical protein
VSVHDIPIASGFRLEFCGRCPHGHMILFDERRVPICQAVIGAAQAEDIAAVIRANDPNFREIRSNESDGSA